MSKRRSTRRSCYKLAMSPRPAQAAFGQQEVEAPLALGGPTITMRGGGSGVGASTRAGACKLLGLVLCKRLVAMRRM